MKLERMGKVLPELQMLYKEKTRLQTIINAAQPTERDSITIQAVKFLHSKADGYIEIWSSENRIQKELNQRIGTCITAEAIKMFMQVEEEIKQLESEA